ncbi:hypothetical protein LMG28614_02546 [Paraburkholderia ultramafica]|uniref:DUF4148 domain-containing protein n=1 Tax=Paraburkholderia ultramafica TaxID=1544867 RepID=A0A6S7B5B2_9BURK|nr:DUF4148 domain-containing protein [Paraburkholderia ultramafica]CAB3787666.1 hypothetical protein LMG28614_02546 [Paraburkholderia ultramafica]
MYSEPRKVVFTGLVIGAVAIGAYAYVSQSGDGWSPADDLGLKRGGESARSARGGMESGTVASGRVKARNDPAATEAARLQAARNSLLRDDVAAARAQPGAVRPAHKNDDQVIELQNKDPRALAEQVDQAPQPVGTSARMSSSSQVNAGHTRDSRFATHEHSNRASSYAKNRHSAETVTAGSGSDSASSGDVSAAGALPVASQPADAPPAMKVVESAPTTPTTPAALNTPPSMQQPVHTVQTAPSSPQDEPAAPTVMSQPLAQPAPSSGTLPKSDGGPKTRAQVRAEIVRARQDGSLPAFGNPDPAGPGGAPSLTSATRP